MSDTYESQVRRFHEATGQPCPSVPAMPDAETRALRVRLLLEEVLEFANASGVEVLSRTSLVMADGSDFEVRALPYMRSDLPAMAHEATDVLYVAVGTLVAMGAPVDACFAEVSAANLRKAPGGKVQRRADGKVLKPEGWKPADVGAVLARATRESLLSAAAHCAHVVEPIPGDEDWGVCRKCWGTGFPLTERAAYGNFKCSACHDTGLVPVPHASGFADGPCRESGCEAGKDAGREAHVGLEELP